MQSGASPLPSTNRNRAGGPATMHDDAANVAEAIEDLASQGFDVVVAMNSYGGFVGIEAVEDLNKASRAARGKPGGVVAFVYLAAHLVTVGQTVHSYDSGLPGEGDHMSLEEARLEEFALAVFGDSTEEASQLYDQLAKHRRASFDVPLMHEGYRGKGLRVSYMHTQRDIVLKTEWQADWIERAKANGVEVDVFEVDAGHVPMIGHEKEVADLMI